MIAGSLLLCVFVRAGPSCLVRHYAVTTFNGNWTQKSPVSCFDRVAECHVFFLALNYWSFEVAVAGSRSTWLIDAPFYCFWIFTETARDVACHPVQIGTVPYAFRFIIFDSCSAYISIRHWRSTSPPTSKVSLCVFRSRIDRYFLYNRNWSEGVQFREFLKEKKETIEKGIEIR